MPGMMEGIRVLEVASWTYVPMAGGVLAEWGAEVIKVEHPVGGDPQRALASSGLVPAGGKVAFVVEHPNRGKRSIGLDVSTDEGRDVLLQLAAQSDVFLTNFLPQARAKLRIDVDDIRAANPKIIYARGSGNGQRGPEAQRGGYDGCTFWSRGGSADTITSSTMEYPPSQPGGAYGDGIGGLTIAGGISTALLHRERTGEAAVVDCSLLAMGMWATAYTIAGAATLGRDRMPIVARDEAPNPLVNMYRTADGRFLTFVMLQSPRNWPDLVTKIGRPELADDPRFTDAAARSEHNRECIAILDEIFASRSLEDWKKVLAGVDGVWSPVQTPSEIIDDPQVVANGYVRDVELDDDVTFKLVATPLQYDETPPEITRAPAFGEHTDEILRELGLSADRIADLRARSLVA